MRSRPQDSVQLKHWSRDKRPDTAMERYLLQREQAFISRILGGTSRLEWLLDVCSGDGWIALPLHRMGLRTVGMDINPVPLALLRGRSNGVPLVQGNAMRLSFADDSLDCIVAIQCLHFLDRKRFLQECSRTIRRGGLLVLESLNRHSYKWLHRRLKSWLNRNPSGAVSAKWLRIPSYSEIVRAMTKHGFEIQAVSGYGWVPLPRHSDSSAVGTLASVERALQLGRWYCVSPRILLAARKTT